jgi:hypothetical protein
MALSLNSTTGNIIAGGNGADGDIVLKEGTGQNRIRLDANGGNAWLGGNGADGDLVLFPSSGDNATLSQATIHLDGQQANMFAGGNGADGDIVLKEGTGQNRIRLDANGGNTWLGGNGADGDLVLFPSGGDNTTLSQATIHLDGQQANMFAGGNGADGDIVLKEGTGQNRIRLDAGGGNAWLGGNGADGDLVLFPSGGDNTTLSQATIHLDGQTGDIKLSGADCAEDFDVLALDQIEPGTVLVVDQEDTLLQSKKAYDKRVVGVISGAGECRPGIILNKKHSQNNRVPVALTGKTYCKVDAQYSSIEVGDLLTTSPTLGHAMKASDPLQAFGAVIGKALHSLKEGKGLIPILVALQ